MVAKRQKAKGKRQKAEMARENVTFPTNFIFHSLFVDCSFINSVNPINPVNFLVNSSTRQLVN
jgi:hypothetical protein